MLSLRENLHKLHMFTVIAESGSLHRASAVLRTSQPGLTVGIKSLEEQIGQKLFYRSKKGMKLTERGQELLVLSRNILREVDSFQFSDRKRIKHLRICTYDSIAQILASKIYHMPEFIDLTLKVENSGLELLDILNTGQADFVIVAEPVASRDLYFEEICKCTYRLYAESGWAESPNLRMEDLRRYPLIFLEGSISSSHGTVERFIYENNLGKSGSRLVNSYSIASKLTGSGCGIGLLVDKLCKDAVDKKEIKEIPIADLEDIDFPETSLYLGCKSVAAKTARFEAVLDAAQVCLNSE